MRDLSMLEQYNRQYDKSHKRDRLYVHWDVSTQCQFNCSYCYAISDYGEDWGKIDTWSRQKLVIRNISKSTLPVFLGLLGGEPTIHPQYTELIEMCHQAISKHKDGRLYVTTNGVQEKEFFESHKYYDNVYFLWSAHMEYEHKYEEGFTRLLENITIMKDKGFRNKVNVMLHPNPKLWKKIHKLVDDLEAIGGIEIHPHFLYDEGNVHALHHYPEEFYEEFKRFKDYPEYLVFESDNKTEIYNDYNIFHNNFTSFKGWNCWNNNYEINWLGEVNRFCFEEKADLIKDFRFFENIKEVKPAVCPHDTCNCDGLLKIYKEKQQ